MKKIRPAAIISIIFLLILSGCSKTVNQKEENSEPVVTVQENAGQEEEKQENIEQKEEEKQENSEQEDKQQENSECENDKSENSESDSEFSFEDLSDVIFSFLSGAGGWSTEVKVAPDGSFTGYYHDSEMGDSSDAYPDGTIYVCDFSGQFSEPVKVNDYTYSVQLDSLTQEGTPSEEEIRDKVRYITSSAYGIEGAKTLLIYLPGAPVKELPQEYIDWISSSVTLSDNLSFYGLYNVEMKQGFSSVIYEETELDTELTACINQSSILEEKLQKAETQSEMNTISGQLSKLWDDELNALWKQLKEHLDEETMQMLTQEEKEWIKEKEAQVKETGAQYEGGSMKPMQENKKLYELTRERVFVLADYLRK